MSIQPNDITVAIPTYRREAILIETLERTLALNPRAASVLIVDQTADHEPATERRLRDWHESGHVRWLRQAEASIPRAMNRGLLEARTAFVLFFDDDVMPGSAIVDAHCRALGRKDDEEGPPWCVAGQVLQPGEEVVDFSEWSKSWFPFNSNTRRFITDLMAGNLCVDREKALSIGGFDENFVGSAYRFESDFARRVLRNGGRILFEPAAGLRHLRADAGGTRSYGHHLTTWRPHHAVGKYYFAYHGGAREAFRALLVQPFRAVRTRHHLRKPWWIAATLVAELLAACWAALLFARGRRLVGRTTRSAWTERRSSGTIAAS